MSHWQSLELEIARKRVTELEALLRLMLCSNEMSNGWKSKIQAALNEK